MEMDLTQGTSFDAERDPYINHEMDKHSKSIYVYGIDSAFMTEFDKCYRGRTTSPEEGS